MRHTLAGLALLPALVVSAQNPPSPTTLDALRDHYRPLLVFARSPDDPALLAQFHMLKDDAPGLTERDVLLLAVPYNTPSPTPLSLTPNAALNARHRFHIAPTDFVVLLIGKDGGEKLRSTKPVPFAKLRDKIDSMPMRQQEIKDAAQR